MDAWGRTRGVNKAALQPSLIPVMPLPHYEGHMKRAASLNTVLWSWTYREGMCSQSGHLSLSMVLMGSAVT